MALRQDVGLSLILLFGIPVAAIILGLIVSRMVPAFQADAGADRQINRVLREQITGIRVVRAFVREPQESTRFAEANARADRHVAAGRPADVVDVPDRQPGHQPVERGRALARRQPDQLRPDAGRLARRLPQLPRPDPDVGGDGHVHDLDDPPGGGVGRAASRRSSRPSPPWCHQTTRSARCPHGVGRVPRRRLPLPGRRPPGADRHLLHRPGRADRRDRREHRAPARPRWCNSSRDCSTPRSGTVMVDGVDVRQLDTRACSGNASGWCRRSPTSSRGRWPATCAYGKPDATEAEMWEALRGGPGRRLRAAHARRPRRPHRAGRHQRLGRPAPAAGHRPGAGPQARDLPVRRLVLGPRPGHRRPPARRSRSRTPPKRPCSSSPSGCPPSPPPTTSSSSRTASSWAGHPRRAAPRPARPTPRSCSPRSASGRWHDLGRRPARGSGRTGLRRRPRPVPPAGGNAAGVPTERSKDFAAPSAGLARLLAPEGSDSSSSSSSSVASAVLNVFGPRVLGHGTDIIVRGCHRIDGIDFSRLHGVLWRRVGALRRRPRCSSMLSAYILAGVVQRLMRRLRSDGGGQDQRPAAELRRPAVTGDLLSRVTNDIDNIAQSLQQTMSQMLTSILLLIGVAVMMFTISPLLAVVALTTVPLSVFAMRMIAARARPRFMAQWRTPAELNAQVEETLHRPRHREVLRPPARGRGSGSGRRTTSCTRRPSAPSSCRASCSRRPCSWATCST